jgi:hypothetical protein
MRAKVRLTAYVEYKFGPDGFAIRDVTLRDPVLAHSANKVEYRLALP